MKRNTTFKSIFLTTVLTAFICLQAPGQNAAINAVVDRFPAKTPGETCELAAEIIKLGKPAIAELCTMVSAPGKGDDTKARFALSALTWYVVRPGAPADEAETFTSAVADALKTAQDDEIKSFFISRLHLAGHDESVPVLAEFLTSERLCDPAVQALLAIRTKAVNDVLLKELPSANGKRLVTIIKALGELREPRAAKEITKHAGSADRDTRLTALYALANIGPECKDTDTLKLLTEAIKSETGFNKTEIISYYILYLEKMALSGNKNECAALCRTLIKDHPEEENLQASAAAVLVSAVGADANDDLIALAESGGRQIRNAVLKLACKMPGKGITGTWIKKSQSAPADLSAEILDMLGERGDVSAVPAICAGISNNDKTVRLASIRACAKLGGPDCVKALISALQTDQRDEVAAVKQALMNIKGRDVTEIISGALSVAPAEVQPSIIEILSRRGDAEARKAVTAKASDSNTVIRIAAINALGVMADGSDLPVFVNMLLKASDKSELDALCTTIISTGKMIPDDASRSKPLLGAMNGASKEHIINIIGLLKESGGKDAYTAVAGVLKDADADIQNASVRAIAGWKSDEAVADLLNIICNSSNDVHKVLATRGLVRIVGESNMAPADKVTTLDRALKASSRPDERKLVISALSGIKTRESLMAVAECLNDKDVQAEAAVAVAQIVCPANKNDNGLVSEEVGRILRNALPLMTDANLRARAEGHLKKIPAPAK